MRNSLLILSLLAVTTVQAEADIDEVMEVLKLIETENTPTAKGDYRNGVPTSFGVLQIQQGALDDVNRRYGTSYTVEDVMTVNCAEEVFQLYIEMWADHFKDNHDRYPNEFEIARIWNGGPYGYKKRATLEYLTRYKTRKELIMKQRNRAPMRGRTRLTAP